MVDEAYDMVLENIKADYDKMWTSVELHGLYLKQGGFFLSRRQLMDSIQKATIEKFLLLTSPGIASIIVPKAYASTTLRIQEVEKDDIDLDGSLKMVAKAIVSEAKEIPCDKKTFSKKISLQSVKSEVSPTFSKLLALISPLKLGPDSSRVK